MSSKFQMHATPQKYKYIYIELMFDYITLSKMNSKHNWEVIFCGIFLCPTSII